MTKNQASQIVDITLLRSQLLFFKQLVDSDSHKIDILLKLPDEKLLILLFISKQIKAKTKEINDCEYIHLSRSTVIDYCKELAKQKLLGVETDPSKHLNIKPTYIFHISDASVKKIFSNIKYSQIQKKDNLNENNEDKDFDNDENPSPFASSFFQEFSRLPTTGREVLTSIDKSGVTCNIVAEKINCASKTSHKYLKHFFDRGWLIRDGNGKGRGVRYRYYLHGKILNLLTTSANNSHQVTGEDCSVDNKERKNNQVVGSSTNTMSSSKLKQWKELICQTKQIEQELIASGGEDAKEFLEYTRKKYF